MGSRLTSVEVDRWHTLCAELLPPALRATLVGVARPVGLVVVPQGRLAAFPWAALRLDDGRALVEAAVIQLTPSLALLAPELTWPPAASGTTLVSYLDPKLATDEERASLAALGHLAVAGETEMARAVRSGSVAGVYIAAHGNDVGMAQHVVFDGKLAISAGSALALPWPPWVIFAPVSRGAGARRARDGSAGVADQLSAGRSPSGGRRNHRGAQRERRTALRGARSAGDERRAPRRHPASRAAGRAAPLEEAQPGSVGRIRVPQPGRRAGVNERSPAWRRAEAVPTAGTPRSTGRGLADHFG